MNYKILVHCGYCDRPHPTGLTIELDDGPEKKQTVAEFFRDKRLPEALGKPMRNAVLCKESGESVVLKSPEEVYLVREDED